MEIAVRHQLRSETPFSKPLRVLYRFASVLGAIYNRRAFPRKRHFAIRCAIAEIFCSGAVGGLVHAAFVGREPPRSLRQRGARVGFPGAAITSQCCSQPSAAGLADTRRKLMR